MDFSKSIHITKMLNDAALPAREVLNRTLMNKAQRVANETREELDLVMQRVVKITDYYDKSLDATVDGSNLSNIQYLSDLDELHAIIKDPVLKRKYQHQVTVFVVGYQDVCSTRLKLIQQIGEFLSDAEVTFDKDFEVMDAQDMSLDAIESAVDDSLVQARHLTEKLGELNQQMIDYLVNASNSKMNNKNKRKLEKAIENAKAEANQLSVKLLATQEELNQKDEKLQHLFQQYELKNMEAQKYRTAAELAKKSVEDSSQLQNQLKAKDEQLRKLQVELQSMQLQLNEVGFMEQNLETRSKGENQQNQAQIDNLRQALKEKNSEIDDTRYKMRKDYEAKIEHIEKRHRTELLELKRSYEDEIRQLKNLPALPSQLSIASTEVDEDNDNQGSEFDENAVTYWMSDEEKSETRQGSSRSKLSKKDEELHKIKEEAVLEILTFQDQFDLGDEAAWSNLPPNHINGRFKQYRDLTVDALAQYESKVADMVQNAGRKVQNLKMQFQEHKSRWERERQLLVQVVNQSEAQKSEAQGYAERTMEQLELFINDTEKQLQKSQDETENASKEETDREAVLHAKLALLEMQKAEMEARLANQELEVQDMATRLLQQTDDAKLAAEQLNEIKREIARSSSSMARRSSHAESGPVDSSISAMRQTAEETRLALKAAQNSHFEDNLEKIKTSSLNDLELDEGADAPFPPDLLGDSAMIRNGVTIANHPIVQEYVKTYQNLMTFKENLAQLLLKEEIKAQANELLEMESCNFDKGTQVMPQVENMSKNVALVLQQITLLVENIILNTKMTSSKRRVKEEEKEVNSDVLELQEKYEVLRRKLEESEKMHEDKLNANTSVMLEMQSTIGVLRREISSLTKNKASSDVHSLSRQHLPPLPNEPTVIFTRVDSERNARILKKAHNEMRIDSESYDLALAGMCEYTRLPAQRLVHLVRRYVHEHTLRKIADQVRHLGHADPELLFTLDRMEKLEQRRTRRYSQLMEFMTAERLRLANRLVDTFEHIEEQCSIFLIKPVLSLRNKAALRDYYSLLMQQQAMSQQDTRVLTKSSGTSRLTTTPGFIKDAPAPAKKANVQIEGFGLVPAEVPTTTFWQPASAQNRSSSRSLTDQLAMINTPRLLELDINRVLLGQNNVSVTYDNSEKLTELSPQNIVRSYVTVTRPSAQTHIRPVIQDQKIPPTTPQFTELNFYGASKDLTGTPSLPPITPTPRNFFDDEDDNNEETIPSLNRQATHLSVQ